MQQAKRIEQILGIGALLLLCVAIFLIVKPFLSALLLGVILTISTWPIYRWTLGVTGGRRTLAAGLVTLVFLLTLVVPFVLIVPTIGDQSAGLKELAQNFTENGLPDAPDWLRNLPVGGEFLAERWNQFVSGGRETLNLLKPYASTALRSLVQIGAVFGGALLELCLAILISFIFFRHGDVLSARFEAVLGRLAGTRAADLTRISALTLKGVVYGILGTALIQGALAWIGFAITGVPSAGLLGVLTFFLSLVPLGPPLIWIPATIWLFNTGQTSWGIALLIWSAVVVSGSDNIVKPMLIARGSDLPMVLIFLGVIGGALQFGVLGVFIGPTLLAVGYSLLEDWFEASTRAES